MKPCVSFNVSSSKILHKDLGTLKYVIIFVYHMEQVYLLIAINYRNYS